LKSAQFVFYPWLLDAMEAPVPISAQLHSSTLVIIGFYVVLRLWPSVAMWGGASGLLVFVGSVTSLGASVLGLRQFDGKRLLACSTAGQLGYVNIALGLGMQGEAMLLLAFCCCNKAYTFVWLGSLMERVSGLSDFRLLRQVSILFIERAGLFSALLNSTIFPGAFAWHLKSLLSRGLILSDGLWVAVGVEVVALTWFLSLIYMSRLLSCLFLAPGQSVMSWVSGFGVSWALVRQWCISGGKLSCLVFIALFMVAASVFYCSELSYVGMGIFGSAFDTSVYLAMPL
jgi:NADH-quinone oxidoreductase subunit L